MQSTAYENGRDGRQIVTSVLARLGHQPGALLPVLHAVQDELGHVPSEAVPVIAEALNLSRAEVHGVLTYYHHFRAEPAGKHVVQVCRAEACQAMGGEALWQHAQHRLACQGGPHSRSADGQYTLESVYCLGLCAMSPALRVGDDVHARMSPAKFDRLVQQLEATA